MVNNHFGRKLTAFERHQYAAAGERIDERRGVADREQAFRRRGTLPAELFPTGTEPFGSSLRGFERVTRARVLHHHLAHDAIGIGVAALHLLGADDETEIARAGFDTVESAVAAAVEIDLTRTRRDTRVLKMRFKGDQFWFVFL